MASIFTKIINREIPGHFVYEDEQVVAILDKFPTVPGQVLVIPKKEVPYVFDLDEKTYAHLFVVTKNIGRALDVVFGTLRTCVVVEGFDVPHVHVKLYPIQNREQPLGILLNMGNEASDEDLATLATKIRTALT